MFSRTFPNLLFQAPGWQRLVEAPVGPMSSAFLLFKAADGWQVVLSRVVNPFYISVLFNHMTIPTDRDFSKGA